jgi:transcription elongation factor GreA
MATDPAETSIRQLRQTRDYLRMRLDEISARFRGNTESSGLEGNVTFAMAQRNFIQGNLERVEHQLLLARVSRATTRHETVGIGNVVHIRQGSETRKVMIIPPENADPTVEYVSAQSLLGKALLGKRSGSTVAMKTPHGKHNFNILRIT